MHVCLWLLFLSLCLTSVAQTATSRTPGTSTARQAVQQQPAGTEITAYVNGDMKLDIAKFQPAAPANGAASSSSEGARRMSAKLQLESTPPGADIEIDGSFVGNAPSDVQVTEGEHTVSVKKAGFKDWERKVKVSGGSSIRLSAELEKTQNQ